MMQYCEQCGKPLSAQARFCGRCGRPVPQPVAAPQRPPAPPVQQPVAPQPPTEQIISALPMGSQRSGFLGMKAEGFVLVLTNLRILVAQQTPERMKENARLAKENARQSGKGFFGQWGAVVGSYGSQRYLQMHPQQILDETPGNYFIANNQIRSVRIKEDYDPEDVRNDVTLTIEAVNGKFAFNYTNVGKRELKQALAQTLGNRVC
jgi:hypothetical protein